MVAGYALTFAAFMLTGGKLADHVGRRRIFMIGLVVFTGASLACGLAPNGGFLIGARVVQGLGGALMNPATLSIITATFAPKRARQGDRHLGRRLCDGARDRPAGRRRARRARELELDLLHQRPGRRSSASSPRPILIQESRDESKVQRPDIPGLARFGGRASSR